MYKFYCDLCGRESATHSIIKTPYFHYYKYRDFGSDFV